MSSRQERLVMNSRMARNESIALVTTNSKLARNE